MHLFADIVYIYVQKHMYLYKYTHIHTTNTKNTQHTCSHEELRFFENHLANAFNYVRTLPAETRGIGQACMQMCMEMAVAELNEEERDRY